MNAISIATSREQAIIAQKEHLKELAKGTPEGWMSDNFSKGIGFAPSGGGCDRCKRQIYLDGGISIEMAMVKLTSECPFCHTSFVD